MIMNNKNNVFDAKRLIGRRYDDPNIQSDSKLWPFKVVSEGGEPKIEVEYKDEIKRFSPGEISSVVLTKIKEMVEAYLGRTVRDAVITVPANFNVSQRRATKNAGTVAGLNVLRILNEPTAAALAHGLNKNLNKNLKGEHNILIFDLGGGTFDVSILTIDKSSLFEVRATADDTHLGGEDFDNRLVNHLADKFKRKYHKDIRSNLRALQRLRTAAERAKRALSSSTETSLEIDALSEGIDFYTKVSRARFEELCADLFRATLQPVEKALADAQMDKGSIHDVILLGGSSRIPKIQSLLENFFCGQPLDWCINPDEAAVQEVIPTMDTSSQIQSIPVDVVPLSLGIETAGGVMVKIIKRNSPIPCKQTHTFTTYTDNQPIIAIHVFEGERAMAKDNNLLGKFYITGFPPAPRGVCKIEITFDIDANGTLNVSAEEIGTGISQNITIQNDKGRLSQKDIDHLLAEAEHCREEDEKHKQRMAARYQLSWYICSLKNAIDKRGQKLSKENKNRVQSLCDDAIRWMDNNTGAEKEAYEAKLKDLQSTCEPVMMKIYEGDGNMRGSCS